MLCQHTDKFGYCTLKDEVESIDTTPMGLSISEDGACLAESEDMIEPQDMCYYFERR